MPLDKGAAGRDPDGSAYARRRKRQHQKPPDPPPVRGEDATDKARAPRSRRVRFEQERNREIARQYGTGRAGGNQQAPGFVSGVLGLGPLAEGAVWSFTHPRERLRGDVPDKYLDRDERGRTVHASPALPWGPTRGFFRSRRGAPAPEPTPTPEVEPPRFPDPATGDAPPYVTPAGNKEWRDGIVDLAYERGYLYHRAAPDVLDSIRVEGLAAKTPRGDVRGVYFGDNPLQAAGLSWKRGGIYLRVQRDKVPDLEERAFGESLTRRPVPPQDLEYLGADGKWHPVAPPLKSVEERIGGLLDDARLAEQEQAAIYSQERGAKIGAASGAYERAGGGEAGRIAALGALRGELTKVKFRGLDNITPDELDRVNDYIKNHPDFEGYRWVQAQAAVQRVLNGQTPRKFEIKLLDELFGPEKVAEIAKDIDLAIRLKGYAGSAWNLPRAAKSSMDVSGGLRQGALVAASHPRLWKQAWGPSMRATTYAVSPAQREALAAREAAKIMQRPNFERYETGGLALAGIGRTAREEAFASNFSDYIPGIGHSAQQYTVFLNTLRADYADLLIKDGRRLGFNVDDPEFLRNTMKIVNEFTGRGTFEGYEGAVRLLSGMFFSPRLMAARFKTLSRALHPYTWTGGRGPKANPNKRIARREARRAMSTFIGSGMGVLLVASQMPGVEVGLDPRSADFGKIRVGDTRVDIWAGFQPYVVAAARIATGEKVNSATGEVQDLERYGSGRVTGSLSNFFENKFAPQVAYLWQWDKAGKATGQEFEPVPEFFKLFAPIGFENAGETVREYGPGRAAVEFGAGFVGFGANTYGAPAPSRSSGDDSRSPYARRRAGEGSPYARRRQGSGSAYAGG